MLSVVLLRRREYICWRDSVWIRVQAELFVALRGTAESGRKTLIIMHCCNSTSIGIIPPLFVVKRLSALLETHRKYMPLHCIALQHIMLKAEGHVLNYTMSNSQETNSKV